MVVIHYEKALPVYQVYATQQCEAQFRCEMPVLQLLLSSAVNGDHQPLQLTVLRLTELTMLRS